MLLMSEFIANVTLPPGTALAPVAAEPDGPPDVVPVQAARRIATAAKSARTRVIERAMHTPPDLPQVCWRIRPLIPPGSGFREMTSGPGSHPARQHATRTTRLAALDPVGPLDVLDFAGVVDAVAALPPDVREGPELAPRAGDLGPGHPGLFGGRPGHDRGRSGRGGRDHVRGSEQPAKPPGEDGDEQPGGSAEREGLDRFVQRDAEHERQE